MPSPSVSNKWLAPRAAALKTDYIQLYMYMLRRIRLSITVQKSLTFGPRTFQSPCIYAFTGHFRAVIRFSNTLLEWLLNIKWINFETVARILPGRHVDDHIAVNFSYSAQKNRSYVQNRLCKCLCVVNKTTYFSIPLHTKSREGYCLLTDPLWAYMSWEIDRKWCGEWEEGGEFGMPTLRSALLQVDQKQNHLIDWRISVFCCFFGERWPQERHRLQFSFLTGTRQ